MIIIYSKYIIEKILKKVIFIILIIFIQITFVNATVLLDNDFEIDLEGYNPQGESAGAIRTRTTDASSPLSAGSYGLEYTLPDTAVDDWIEWNSPTIDLTNVEWIKFDYKIVGDPTEHPGIRIGVTDTCFDLPYNTEWSTYYLNVSGITGSHTLRWRWLQYCDLHYLTCGSERCGIYIDNVYVDTELVPVNETNISWHPEQEIYNSTPEYFYYDVGEYSGYTETIIVKQECEDIGTYPANWTYCVTDWLGFPYDNTDIVLRAGDSNWDLYDCDEYPPNPLLYDYVAGLLDGSTELMQPETMNLYMYRYKFYVEDSCWAGHSIPDYVDEDYWELIASDSIIVDINYTPPNPYPDYESTPEPTPEPSYTPFPTSTPTYIPTPIPTIGDENYSINTTLMDDYYNFVNNTLIELKNNIHGIANFSLIPITSITNSINGVNESLTNYTISSGYHNILLDVLIPFFSNIPEKVLNLTCYYLTLVLILLIFRRE